MAEPEALWTSAQCAQYLGVTDDALYRMRLSGEGPPFLMVRGRSKFRDRPSAVAAWLAQSESPSMAALAERKAKQVREIARQRESMARARLLRWPKKP